VPPATSAAALTKRPATSPPLVQLFEANCDEGAAARFGHQSMECRFQPAGDPVELRLRNDTDIGPYIMATNADMPEFDAYSQAASMKERARVTPRILAS
jgi:hypothetical protein